MCEDVMSIMDGIMVFRGPFIHSHSVAKIMSLDKFYAKGKRIKIGKACNKNVVVMRMLLSSWLTHDFKWQVASE